MSLPGCYQNGTFGVPISADYSCANGFYCPNITGADPYSLPAVCPPTIGCQIQRLLGQVCLPQGMYEPLICAPGHYCSNYTIQQICPEGYFCPSGTFKPNPCYDLSYCPAGSVTQEFYGGLLLCLLFDLILFFIMLFARLRFAYREALYRKGSKVAAQNTRDIDVLVDYNEKELGMKMVPIDFDFDCMGLVLPNRKEVLRGVSGKISGGRMVALMGPSGAGKTTFMNVLMGKVNRTSGSLLVNGQKLEVHEIRKVIGYVPQEDVMLRELTVKENILHAARIKLTPKHWKSSEIKEFVNVIMEVLGLSNVQNSKIGDEMTRGVSGGQRKRVNIALELAGVPMALFLDEPTSGLDSTASLQVAELLKQMTRLGTTIVSVIHQPRVEIFEKFDDVLLLIPGGRTAYIGPVVYCVPYFRWLGFSFPANANPADLIMDILSGKGGSMTPTEIADKWIEQGLAKVEEMKLEIRQEANIKGLEERTGEEIIKHIKELIKVKGAHPFWQTMYCLERALVQQSRTMSSFWLELFVSLAAGFIMGGATNGYNELFQGIWIYPYSTLSPAPQIIVVPLFSLMIAMSSTLAVAPAGVKVFGEERTVFWREAAAGHSRISYYFAKVFSVFPRFLLSALHFTAIFFYLSKPVFNFHILFFVIALLYYGVYGVSSCVSMIVKREDATLLAVIIGMIFSVFCGFGPSISDGRQWNLLWLWEIMFNKWAGEVLFNEWAQPYASVYEIQAAADNFGYALNQTPFGLWMMVIIGTVWRIIAFILMIVTKRDKQR